MRPKPTPNLPDKNSTRDALLLATPRPLPFWKSLGADKRIGVTVRREDDGSRYMFLITSNSYRDLEKETLTTKSLSAYVEQAWKANKFVDPQPYYYWHDKSLPRLGTIVWADMHGPFLIEVAKEADNAFAHKVFDYVESHPKLRWGTSHGYEYLVSTKDKDGTYHRIKKFESSLLPLWAAANPYTLSVVLGGTKEMTTARDKYLDENILRRKGGAAKLRRIPASIEATLEQEGVMHKGIHEKIQQHLTKITDDPQLQAKLHRVMAMHMAGIADANGTEPDDDDMQKKGLDDMDIEDEVDTPNDDDGGEVEDIMFDDDAEDEAPLIPMRQVRSASPAGVSDKALREVVKSFDERFNLLEEAMSEVADFVHMQKANSAKARQSSIAPETEVQNPSADFKKAVKRLNENRTDDFWG